MYWRDPVGTVPRRNHATRAFKTEREAKRERTHVEREEEGRVRPIRSEQPTLANWIAATIGLDGDEGRGWIVTPRRPLSPSTRARYQVAARVHLIPELGGYRLSDLTTAYVEAYFTRLQKRGVGVPTLHVLRKMLSALYSAAIKAGHVSTNPISAIELPAEEEREPRFLSVGEIDAIAAELTGTDRALFLTLCYAGLRIGEAVALRVGDVDFERRRITVRSAVAEVHGHPVEGRPKSKKTRAVHIPNGLLGLLREEARSKLPSSRIFSTPRGADIRSGNWRRRRFQPACVRAEIAAPRPTVHDCRHTAASLAIAAGAHPKQIAEMLGHASVLISLNRLELLEVLDDSPRFARGRMHRSGNRASAGIRPSPVAATGGSPWLNPPGSADGVSHVPQDGQEDDDSEDANDAVEELGTHWFAGKRCLILQQL